MASAHCGRIARPCIFERPSTLERFSTPQCRSECLQDRSRTSQRHACACLIWLISCVTPAGSKHVLIEPDQREARYNSREKTLRSTELIQAESSKPAMQYLVSEQTREGCCGTSAKLCHSGLAEQPLKGKRFWQVQDKPDTKMSKVVKWGKDKRLQTQVCS